MGPLHGKLAVHRPSTTIGIARSRKLHSPNPKIELWEYSLLLADGTRTDFLPGIEMRKAKREHIQVFQNARQHFAQLRATAVAGAPTEGDLNVTAPAAVRPVESLSPIPPVPPAPPAPEIPPVESVQPAKPKVRPQAPRSAKTIRKPAEG